MRVLMQLRWQDVQIKCHPCLRASAHKLNPTRLSQASYVIHCDLPCSFSSSRSPQCEQYTIMLRPASRILSRRPLRSFAPRYCFRRYASTEAKTPQSRIERINKRCEHNQPVVDCCWISIDLLISTALPAPLHNTPRHRANLTHKRLPHSPRTYSHPPPHLPLQRLPLLQLPPALHHRRRLGQRRHREVRALLPQEGVVGRRRRSKGRELAVR